MSIRDTAIWFRDIARDVKNKLRLNTTFLAAKRRGDILKRIEDFDKLLGFAHGSTVLDLGCYDGLIAYEFFRSGAKLIHGLDNDAYHINTANRLFSQVHIPSIFVHADLRKPGMISSVLGDACEEKYDIVLFLGVYQHIYKSMSLAARKAVVTEIIERAGSILAIRIPKHVWVEFEPLFPCNGFDVIHTVEHKGNVGELRIYRRHS